MWRTRSKILSRRKKTVSATLAPQKEGTKGTLTLNDPQSSPVACLIISLSGVEVFAHRNLLFAVMI